MTKAQTQVLKLLRQSVRILILNQLRENLRNLKLEQKKVHQDQDHQEEVHKDLKNLHVLLMIQIPKINKKINWKQIVVDTKHLKLKSKKILILKNISLRIVSDCNCLSKLVNLNKLRFKKRTLNLQMNLF